MVASNAGGNAEIVQEGVTGHHFQRENPRSLHDMGLKGRAYVQRHHTLDLFGRKYRALYDNLIRGGRIEQLS